MSCNNPWAGKRALTNAARDAVVREVHEETRISPRDILSEARFRPIVHARQLCMWKLRQTGHYGYVEIGRAFNRDHTTAIHAVRAVNARMCGESVD